MTDFIAADTEDNSPELKRTGRSGFEKKVTQVAAIGANGERFYFRPKVKRTVKRRGFVQHLMDMEPFYNWLAGQGESRCYFHNTRYDLGNLFPSWIREPERGAVPLDALDLSLVGNRLISARWRNVTFLDSFNLWPMALAQVGDAVGIKKGDMDVRSRGYVDNDCAIVRKAIQTAARLAAEFECQLPATLGSLCVRIWHAIGGSNWHWSDQDTREAYFGGRVELFQKGGVGDILYTDINSLYPSCMTNPFPCESQGDDAQPGAALWRWGVASVTLDVPRCHIAPLPVQRDDGSITYPWGKLKGTWTTHEIRNAIEYGARLIEVHWQQGSDRAWPYYRKFVNLFYQRRRMVLPGMPDADPGTALFLKLLLNNLYGQLGMSGLVTRSLTLDKWIVRDALDSPVLDENGEPRLKKEGTRYGRKLLAEIQMPLPPHANYMHAAYVTSYARLALQNFLRRVPGKDLIYCDTDSLFFFCKGKPPFPIGNELGQMKLEARATWAEVLGPKFYGLEVAGKRKYKAKGIPRRGEYAKNFFLTGRAEFEQPFGLRESIAYFDEPITKDSRVLSVWHPVEKRALAGYDKKAAVKRDGKLFFEPLEL